MKTIFLVIDDGFIVKNILQTEVFSTLRMSPDIQLCIITDTKKVADYEHRFGGVRVMVEGIATQHLSLSEVLWGKFLRNIPRTKTSDISMFGGPFSTRKGLLTRFFIRLIQFMFNNPKCRMLIRSFDMLFFRDREYDALFKKYQPILVFAGNVFSPSDVGILRVARRHGIKTVGMLKGWDNPTSKGLIRFHPDHMVVHSYRMRDELKELHDYPSNHTFISGVPQYDMYFTPDDSSREEFWGSYGLDSQKKVVLYLEPGLFTSQRGYEIWIILDAFLKEKCIQPPSQIFISFHPAYKVKDEVLAELPNLYFYRFGLPLSKGRLKSVELTDEDLHGIMRMIRYADLVINTASTTNIEAAIFDKPTINIAFDGFAPRPYYESVRQFYDYTHLRPVVESGGVKIAYDKEELLEQINELLAHPDWGSAGRKKIVKEQCVYTDGKSGERIGNFILSLLE